LEGRCYVVGVPGTIGERFTDLLRPLPEQVRAPAFPVRQDMLDSGLKALLDTAASDQVVAQIRPTLCNRLHRSYVCTLDHCLHLVHVALKAKFRGGLFREALIRRNVFQAADALVAHGYCPLISM
jgi:hypothetical protein